MRMHDFARASAVAACKRSASDTLRPNAVSKPRCRKSRRATPSHRGKVRKVVFTGASMVEGKLAGIKQGPEQIFDDFRVRRDLRFPRSVLHGSGRAGERAK